MRCLVRASSDTSLLDELDVEIAVGDLDAASIAALAPWMAAATCSTAARWSPTGRPARRSREPTSRAPATCSTPRVDASVQRFIHFSTTDVYGYPGRRGDRRDPRAPAGFATGTRRRSCDAEAEVRRAETSARCDAVDPAPGDRLRARLDRRRRRDRARDPRRQHAADRRRSRGRRPLLRREPRSTRRCSRSATRLRPATPSTSATASTSPGRSSPTAWPRASAARRSDGACPIGWPTASASRSSTATGCCAGPPVCSHRRCSRGRPCRCWATNQDFSNRKAREMLGWEPRVDYPSRPRGDPRLAADRLPRARMTHCRA